MDPKSPQIKPPISSAFDLLKRAIQADPGYAWSWHCNVAMPILDACNGMSHEHANEAAASVMRHLFGVDTTESAEWRSLQAEWRTARGFAQNGEG